MGADKEQPKNALLETVKALDVKLSYKLALASSENSRLGFLRQYCKLLEFSCHAIPWLGGSAVMLWVSSGRDTKAFICNLYIALIADIICVAIVKALTRRRRPVTNKRDMPMTFSVDKLSFPSGHVTRSVLVTAIFHHLWPVSPFLNFFIHIWCICVCVSRVLLGRHHVGDVLGGLVIGWLLYCFISLIWLSTDAAIGILSIFMNTEFEEDT